MPAKEIAIICGDIHLSHNPPVARAKEPDWYEAMKRQLLELSRLAKDYDVPILCTGDVFHHWNSPPELINFSLDFLPEMYCIPGQHDLPNHSHDHIHKSAYRTLEKAGILHTVKEPILLLGYSGFILHGFPWGTNITQIKKSSVLDVALLHKYIWIDGAGYNHAPAEALLDKRDPFPTWDVVAIGDNHTSWDYQVNDTYVFNTGGFFRRRSDELNHHPRIGILLNDGTVKTHYLDTSQDVLIPIDIDEQVPITGFEDFLNRLQDLDRTTMDFKTILKRCLTTMNVRKEVREHIMEALDCGNRE